MVQYQLLSAYDVDVAWAEGQGAPKRVDGNNQKKAADSNEIASRLDTGLPTHTHTLTLTSSAPNIAPVAQGQGDNNQLKPTAARITNLRTEEIKYHLHTHTYGGVPTITNPSLTYPALANFTDNPVSAQVKKKAAHINELRENLEDLKNHTHYGCECQCECTCQCTGQCGCQGPCGKDSCHYD